MGTIDTILSVVMLMLYVITAGWSAGFHAIRPNGEKSIYSASKKLSPSAVGISAFGSELGMWLILISFFSIFSSFGLISSYCAAAGTAAGFFLSWCMLAQKIRIYNEISDPASTVPSFLAARIKGNTDAVRAGFGAPGFVFCLLYAAAALSMAAKLMQWMFGINYILCVITAAVLAAAYTIAGGFDSVVISGITKSAITAAVLTAAFIFAYTGSLDTESGPGFISTLTQAINIRNADSWYRGIFDAALGLFFFGSPSLLRRFMALRQRKAVLSARRISLLLSSAGAVLCAAVCTVLAANGITSAYGQTIYASLYMLLQYPLIQAFVTTGALIILIHSAAVQLHISAGMLSEDFLKVLNPFSRIKKRRALADRLILVGIIIAAAASACLYRNGVSMLIYAVSGLTAVFAPTVAGCLYSTKITIKAAVSSAITGALTATLFSCFFPESRATVLLSVCSSAAVLTAASACTKNPYSAQIKSEYERINLIRKCKGRFFE